MFSVEWLKLEQRPLFINHFNQFWCVCCVVVQSLIDDIRESETVVNWEHRVSRSLATGRGLIRELREPAWLAESIPVEF